MATSKESIRKSIKPYLRQQEIIKRILRKHKELSTGEFNRIFANIIRKKVDGKMMVFHSKNRFPLYQPLHILLGDLNQGSWSKWLDLMQRMEMIDIVKTSKIKGEVYYSLKS